jgi:hypothetical protein
MTNLPLRVRDQSLTLGFFCDFQSQDTAQMYLSISRAAIGGHLQANAFKSSHLQSLAAMPKKLKLLKAIANSSHCNTTGTIWG